MTAPLLFGVRVLNFGTFASKNAIVEQAKIAEKEGYYSVWAAERILVPDPPNQPWSKISPLSFEEITVLAHISGFTERVKLGTFVVIVPFRNPLVLARQITTLDVLSNGRTILGLGLGWMKEEFDVSRAKMSEKGRVPTRPSGSCGRSGRATDPISTGGSSRCPGASSSPNRSETNPDLDRG